MSLTKISSKATEKKSGKILEQLFDAPERSMSTRNLISVPCSGDVISRGPTQHQTRGFTLIELMIVVVVVAILAAVAVPSYLESVRQSRRADATTSLSRIQLAQETWRLNNATYGTLANLGLSATSSDGYYSLSIAGQSATGYVATATAVAGSSQANDTGCTTITLRVVGNAIQGSTAGTDIAQDPCWKK